MQFPYHVLIGAAAKIPVPDPVPVISYSPLVLPAPGRPVDIQLRVTVPAPAPLNNQEQQQSSDGLPILLLAHGLGPSNYLSSLDGDTPLAEFYASRGFAVLQPTLLDSAFLGLTAPEGDEGFWRERAPDLSRLIDDDALDAVEAAVPTLQSLNTSSSSSADGRRLDRSRVVVVGHSYGGTTAQMLLGATNTDPRTNETVVSRDERVRAGVVLAAMGNGGADLLEEPARQIVPWYGPDFSPMTAPALVVYGDEDVTSILTNRGADWHADGYFQAPGPKSLLTVRAGRHALGGVSGYDAAETEDESPERLAMVQRMTWAYLWSQLYEGNGVWEEACKAFEGHSQLGTVEHK